MHTADVHTLETCVPQDVLEYAIRVWLLALHRPLGAHVSKVYPNGRASAVLLDCDSLSCISFRSHSGMRTRYIVYLNGRASPLVGFGLVSCIDSISRL